MVIKLKSLIILFLKGIALGGSMTVPGVSGGSMAIVFGIYDKLISAVANFFKHKLKSFVFLLTVSLGGAIGIVILSNMVTTLLKTNPFETSFFFFGTVLGSLPMLFKKAEFKIKVKDFTFCLIGAKTVVLLNLLPKINNTANTFTFIVAGFIGSIALILPGISISYFLLILGAYEPLVNAMNGFNLKILLPFLLSMLIGVFCFSKLIATALQKYTKYSFLCIIGFMLGSLTQLFVGIPQGTIIITSLLSLLAGIYFIYLIGKFAN